MNAMVATLETECQDRAAGGRMTHAGSLAGRMQTCRYRRRHTSNKLRHWMPHPQGGTRM